MKFYVSYSQGMTIAHFIILACVTLDTSHISSHINTNTLTYVLPPGVEDGTGSTM